MGSRRQASYNPTLTSFASGVAQDTKSALADFFAPRVPIISTLGQYKVFNEKNAFQIYDTSRALGGAARRIEFNTDDPTYNAKPQALEIPIDDAEKDAAGDQLLALQQAKARTLVTTAILSREKAVMDVATTLSAVGGGVGAWTTDTTNPIEEVDAQIEAIAKATGMMPNSIAFGLSAWRIFRNHPNVLARFPGAVKIGVTPEQAATLFMCPLEIRYGTMVKDGAKAGAAANKSFVLGSDVFLFIRSTNPTEYDPSWMKSFTGGRGGVDAVHTYYDESCRSDILAVDWSEDIKITSPISAKRITVS